MFRFISIVASFVPITLASVFDNEVDITRDVQVPLRRDDSNTLRVRGYFGPAEGIIRPISPWLRSYDCDASNRTNEFLLTVHGYNGARATFDVSDMVTTFGDSSTLMGLCIGYDSGIARGTDSTIYINYEGHETLVFGPTTPYEFAADEQIAYTRIQPGAHVVYARSTTVLVDGTVPQTTRFHTMAFSINDNAVSTVSEETFASLNRTIHEAGGRLQARILPRITRRWSEVYLENCYENLMNILPAINYFLSDEERVDGIPTSRLVFYPEDYVINSENPNVCKLLIDAVIPGSPLVLTDRLIGRIGGIHFDYDNRRIGFFDPI